MQYFLNRPIMVLAFKDNHQAAVTMPAGKLIDVVGPVENDDRFLVISADDAQFHIFASDLAGRAEPVIAREPMPGFPEKNSASERKPKRAVHPTRTAAAA